ncbi:UDP-N-acetylmuramoyl-L-alanyl-D-glutamate--2,6-diaminopimelate ligase [Paenibacillus thermotolerans]|uniref:UDP-N-acetylmuramoyl-L-alanyl-D-glutamate--2, 6-diaminopimelate ligase n=1 Tax=Paenibacillus thermotolerans TaxID=3027807 RepID=UPI002368DD78|nr:MULTISPECIES: UDP-N-acetylmuramoyl-L-alanyl-D-glutamate--2,6-diaminopimelate ligase [unclassified Paenibacillus]
MQIRELASLFLLSRIIGDDNTEVTGVTADSRHVTPGCLFICVPGYTVDGHDYAEAAANQGAAALVVERELPLHLPQLVVRDAKRAMARIASRMYGYPSRELKVIGVTGTNGKTTTAMLIEGILSAAGFETGLMGTVRTKVGGVTKESKNTTADALALQSTFRSMRDAGAQYCVMEVSSHALEQGRVIGTDFRTAVFTNLTQDHLDYHGTMEQYAAAKELFFARLGNAEENHGPGKFAVLNADDPVHARYKRVTAAETITYGIDSEADVRASDIRMSAQGTSFRLSSFAGDAYVNVKLIGKFNVYNALAAIAATLAERLPLAAVVAALESIPGVEGRVEPVDAGQPFAVLVDYAHTPDGLLNVLNTVNEIKRGRVITVFGCGGDRDKTKRPIMGRIAAERSDYAIVTSDNPRSEHPESIMRDIEAGILEAGVERTRYELIADRKRAIEKAVEMAGPEDVVLIAGKGHETYQIIGGATYEFDDRAVAREAIRGA